MGAIIPLVLQGLQLLPGLIGAFKVVFSGSSATPAQKAEALSAAAGAVVGVVGSVSKGGQAETMQKAQQLLPQFHALTENLMNLAEATGKTGAEKQAYVSGMVSAAMQGWEQLSTGGQATTVEQIKPVVNAAVDTLVPFLFPKDDAGVGEQSNG